MNRDNQEKHCMKRIALILFLVGFASIGAGIAIPLVDSALTQPQAIHSSGCIVYPNAESTPAKNNSKMLVDTTSFLLIVFGVGLLSTGLLYAKVQKHG